MAIPNIVGLVGPSGSYKSEMSKYMRKQHGFSRVHAGRPVKRAMRAAFGVSKAATNGDDKDKPTAMLGGASSRDGMEAVSKAWEEAMPMAISHNMRKRVMKKLAKGNSVVVDGVRSPQQADTLKAMGATLVRMDNGKEMDQSMPMNHKQAMIKNTHYTLDVSGNKNDRMDKCDKMLKEMMA